MRKVDVDVTVRLSLRMEDGMDLRTVLDELEYSFDDTTGEATVIDTEILYDEVRKDAVEPETRPGGRV